jgi:23S rRNA pseudouridine1911/1915/1917 synthase
MRAAFSASLLPTSQRLLCPTAATVCGASSFAPTRAPAAPARRPHVAAGWRSCAVAVAPPAAAAEEPRGEVAAFVVGDDQAGERLDRVLTAHYAGQSRTYFQVLIDEGLVRVNGDVMTVKKRKAVAGDDVEVEFVTPQRELPLAAEDIALDILFEDEHMVVVNKAAGMVVHPAPGNWTGTMVHALAGRYSDHLALGGARPGIVHRLDKGTSGVIIAARTADAHRRLTEMFAARTVEKTYVAITVGSPAATGCLSCVLDAPLGRSPTDRARMAVVAEEAGGRRARSVVEVLGADARGLLHVVRVGLETGRTHQIRVHLRHARAPVLGDDVYGAFDVNRRFRSAAPRPLLHAQRLRFSHPFTGAEVDVSARLPDDMRSLLEGSVCPDFAARFPDW